MARVVQTLLLKVDSAQKIMSLRVAWVFRQSLSQPLNGVVAQSLVQVGLDGTRRRLVHCHATRRRSQQPRQDKLRNDQNEPRSKMNGKGEQDHLTILIGTPSWMG